MNSDKNRTKAGHESHEFPGREWAGRGGTFLRNLPFPRKDRGPSRGGSMGGTPSRYPPSAIFVFCFADAPKGQRIIARGKRVGERHPGLTHKNVFLLPSDGRRWPAGRMRGRTLANPGLPNRRHPFPRLPSLKYFLNSKA